MQKILCLCCQLFRTWTTRKRINFMKIFLCSTSFAWQCCYPFFGNILLFCG